ncbi:MAG: hypothetical protein LBT59_15400 [Clostridiales bacterium]|nr:hypothetical protein [Clostridiales bacterium]
MREAGSVESSYSESGLNTGKTLSEKFYLGGKNATSREFIIKSPLRKPIALTKIKHTGKASTDHAIEALANAYPAQLGSLELVYSLTQNQDLAWAGLYAMYPDYSYDQFPYPNTNNSELTENWILMIDDSDLPNSRWYSGTSIYRPVCMHFADSKHILLNGIKICTLNTNPAVIQVRIKTSCA